MEQSVAQDEVHEDNHLETRFNELWEWVQTLSAPACNNSACGASKNADCARIAEMYEIAISNFEESYVARIEYEQCETFIPYHVFDPPHKFTPKGLFAGLKILQTMPEHGYLQKCFPQIFAHAIEVVDRGCKVEKRFACNELMRELKTQLENS